LINKMSKNCSNWTNVTKVIMGICFIILFLLGLAMAVVCVISLSGSKVLGDMDIQSFTALMWFGLFLGIFLAFISLLGAIGYFSLSRSLLIIVVIAFAVLALLQIVCFSLAFSFRDDFDTICDDAWDSADNSTRAYLEKEFSCCGGSDPNDKPASDFCLGETSSSESSVSSVSSVNETDKTDNAALSSSVVGCVQKLSEFMTDQMYSIGACVLAVTILELAVAVVTVILICTSGKRYEPLRGEDV